MPPEPAGPTAPRSPGRRILLATLGSWGDVRPFLLLGRALRRRGYAVTVAAPEEGARAAVAAGLDGVALTPSWPEGEHAAVSQRLARPPAAAQAEALLDLVMLHRPERQWAVMARALAEPPALVIAHHLAVIPLLAAREAGLPWSSVVLCPGLLPPADVGAGAWATSDEAWQTRVAALERRAEPLLASRLGAARVASALAVLISPPHRLVAASPALTRATDGGAAPLLVTGAWEPTGSSRLPAELERWLADGPPPVVVTLGSMGVGRGPELGRVFARAARAAGRRLLLQRGWAGLEAAEDADLRLVDGLPHGALLPRAAAVVHHAGAGTAHAVAASGRPSIPLPFLLEQRYWAGRLGALGAATDPVASAGLSVETMTAALVAASTATEMATAAARLAGELAGERGLELACREIGRLLGS